MDFKNEIALVESVNSFIGACSLCNDKQVLGGYNAKYMVGGETLYKMQNNILEWKLLPKEAQKKQIQTINDILNLPKFIDDPKVLCKIIKEIYNLPNKELIEVMTKSLSLKKPLEISLRKLFYVWQDLIEILMATLLESENIQVPPDMDLLSNIKFIEFKNNSLFDNFIKSLNYTHKSYCPFDPINRILNILSFPLQKLISLIEEKTPLFININDIYKEIKKIVEQIKLVNNNKPEVVIEREDFGTANELNKCVEIFLKLYGKLFTSLEEREQHYIDISRQILKICSVIELMVLNLTK